MRGTDPGVSKFPVISQFRGVAPFVDEDHGRPYLPQTGTEYTQLVLSIRVCELPNQGQA